MKPANFILVLLPFLFFSCGKKAETTRPVVKPITESIYASGILKSKNQYDAYATVNGVVADVFVREGDTVHKGDPILSVYSEAQRLSRENAALAAGFNDVNANQGKLTEAKLLIELSKNKMKNDSALYFRQKELWAENVGTRVELEQRELAYQNSKTAYFSSVERLTELQRQIDFAASQAQKNLSISSRMESDYTLKSEIDGVVYGINKKRGEMATPQMPLAVIGEAGTFVLEMQVDEYDIVNVQPGMKVLVTMDSYKGQVFEAKVTHINPLMNERTRTFEVDAEFVNPPAVLYPNTSFEANILLQSKEKALLVPRNFLVGDSLAIKANGDTVNVKTGLKDFREIEILSGLTEGDELQKPAQ